MSCPSLSLSRLRLVLLALGAVALSGPARADKIAHPTAVFSGLDKITGRIISFEVATNETVQFGSLQITERSCYTSPATEAPQTVTFAQVDEVDAKKQYKRIFSGWMFAASPGLNGIEHPVYDVWLTDCKGGGEVQKAPETAAVDPAGPAAAAADAQQTAADQAKADRKRRRAEERARRKAAERAARDQDVPMDAPRREPDRAPPARSFFPDEAAGRDNSGF